MVGFLRKIRFKKTDVLITAEKTSRREEILAELQTLFSENNLKRENLVLVCTDGAGERKGTCWSDEKECRPPQYYRFSLHDSPGGTCGKT